jgi:rhamnosyltransferase
MNKISIIIPTYNAEKYLKKLLDKIQTQSIKDYELIIIDSSSTDNTVNIAKEYTDNTIIIPKSEFDHGGTRAKAAKLATGDILIYLTQDAIPADNYTLENIIKVFKNDKVGVAYGRQLNYKNINVFGKHLREFNYGKSSYVRSKKDIAKFGIKTAFLSDSFAAYRKTSLQNIGWFKNGLILG